jgi:hypothetical protein
MSGGGSAYEVLGLEPGAEPAAVELAYKRLIKRHHPDREGGDAGRAAEINRAYFELRKTVAQPLDKMQPNDLAEAIYARRRTHRRHIHHQRRRQPPLWPLVVLAVAVAAYLQREQLHVLVDELSAQLAESVTSSDDGSASVGPGGEIDAPLDHRAVRSGIRLAASLNRAGKKDSLIGESRECHQRLRANPTISRLDRCAAFDDAVVALENHDLAQDGEAFGASAVTARQMAAAKLLSNNYDAIEERLDRIRADVQLALAPPPPIPYRPEEPEASGVTQPPSGAAGSLPPLVGSSDGAAPH